MRLLNIIKKSKTNTQGLGLGLNLISLVFLLSAVACSKNDKKEPVAARPAEATKGSNIEEEIEQIKKGNDFFEILNPHVRTLESMSNESIYFVTSAYAKDEKKYLVAARFEAFVLPARSIGSGFNARFFIIETDENQNPIAIASEFSQKYSYKEEPQNILIEQGPFSEVAGDSWLLDLSGKVQYASGEKVLFHKHGSFSLSDLYSSLIGDIKQPVRFTKLEQQSIQDFLNNRLKKAGAFDLLETHHFPYLIKYYGIDSPFIKAVPTIEFAGQGELVMQVDFDFVNEVYQIASYCQVGGQAAVDRAPVFLTQGDLKISSELLELVGFGEIAVQNGKYLLSSFDPMPANDCKIESEKVKASFQKISLSRSDIRNKIAEADLKAAEAIPVETCKKRLRSAFLLIVEATKNKLPNELEEAAKNQAVLEKILELEQSQEFIKCEEELSKNSESSKRLEAYKKLSQSFKELLNQSPEEVDSSNSL